MPHIEGAACCSPALTGASSQVLWTQVDLDVVDALVQVLGKKEWSTFRLVCTAWKESIDCCIRELRSAKLFDKVAPGFRLSIDMSQLLVLPTAGN